MAESMGSVFFFAADLQVAFVVDELGDAVAHDGVVIHQKDPLPVVLTLILFCRSHIQVTRDV